MMTPAIRVLYVDDESTLLELGKVFMERSGNFTVTTATSAPEALQLLERERVDAIISDYQVPGMDGIQFLVLVRTKFGQIPFILFTGKGREEVVIQAINSEADFYLQKGGDPEAQFAELSHKVKQAVERKSAELALKRSEEKYQVIVDHALEGIMIIDSSANVLFANPAAATLVDIEDSSACIGKNALEIIAPESREAALADLASSWEGRDGYLAQYRIITATARERWVELIGKKISFGSVPAVIVMFRDVTERKRAEEALRESENRYRTLAESSTDDIFIIGRDDTIRFVNTHAAGNLHLPADEIIGKLRKNFFCLDIADTQGTYLQEVFETGKSFREEGKILYGNQEFWQDTSLVPLKDETGTVAAVLGVSRDITERKRAEEALRESEERNRILLNEFPDPIFSLYPDGTYRHVNRAFAEGVGKSVDQIIGRKIWDVFPKDEADKRFSALCTVFSTGEGNEIKVRVPRSDGDRYYVTTIVPVKDDKGSVVSAICSSKDITERKQATDTIALITRKLALINDVTYQYIQNKVTGLMVYAKLSKDAKTEDERFTFIEKEERILADIYQLIKNTQEYQKIGLIQPRWIPVEQSIRIAVSLVDPKEGISVETALHGLELYCDPIIEKIFSKLIDNAVKHGKTATRITFSRQETPDELILICEDDGVGISPAVKVRLFDRLVGEKIRFGLFFIRECLVISGMTIAETGEPGKGARFEITVPKGAWRMKGGDA